ncbi:nitronate monooxygenase [Thermosulfuriphilus ammonigenes]|uniref:Nitronate monooxygenase n=1 Tax=Thermosulfuriphilus ammonigenes TaxID=1936021 RepID=A0A6G7PW49_9BACT|nr:nitronate monooxygenase family protein [Thermosulfuriphilus ammonigenes]MBA2847889.1 nitronate monooxygenase [Thermosulfuriphilus ammonigenes]QIJ71915.1 nitronate monooxygenase [Thermosulfuriphilus ammonigenes]
MAESRWSCNPPPLKIGDLVARVPIVQGGMGVGISLAGLASAVARAGGIGVISAALVGVFEGEALFFKNPTAANVQGLKRQISLAKEKAPEGIIGVNIMVALTDFDPLCQAACEAGADILFCGAGLPLHLPELRPAGSRTKLSPIVSSPRAAKLIAKRWWSRYHCVPDAVVVEGPKAGGHLGFSPDKIEAQESRLEVLVPQVIEAMKPFEDLAGQAIPVIPAGGIYTGADIYFYIHKLGAAGVQMATRFVATYECDASEAFKEAYIKASREDLAIIRSPVGLPGRAIRGKFIQEVEAGKRSPYKCIYHCLKTCDYRKSPYCIAAALINAQRGRLDAGFVFAGANAWRVEKIVSVQELIDELIEEYCQVRRKEEGA